MSKLLQEENVKHNVLNAKNHELEAEIIAQAGCLGAVTIATNMAGRGTDIKLGGNEDMRVIKELSHIKDKEFLEIETKKIYQEVKQYREKVLDIGGLYIIGTERHESRRIDNQLRGRSGRQGDVGGSKFFLSLEDSLLKVLGSDKVKSFLQTLGLKDGEAIEHPWINKSIEKSQKKIENINFEIRKSLLRFDDVINEQRQVVCNQRQDIMKLEDFTDIFNKLRVAVNTKLLHDYLSAHSNHIWDTKALSDMIKKIYGIDIDIEAIAISSGNDDKEIKHVLDKSSADIIINIMEGLKGELQLEVCKRILLSVIDYLWQCHIVNIEDIKKGYKF